MNSTKKFARAAQIRKIKAAFITVLFHAALFAAVTYGTDGDYTKILPDMVQEWLQLDDSNAAKEEIADVRP